MNSKLLHPPIMECGLPHVIGYDLSKKASFSQQLILERDSVLSYTGAKSWHMTVHHNVCYIICALSRFLCKSRHSHSRKKKRGRNLQFFLSIILVTNAITLISQIPDRKRDNSSFCCFFLLLIP